MKKTIMTLMMAGLAFGSTSAFAATTATANGLDLWATGGRIDGEVNFQTNTPGVVISTLNFNPTGNYFGLGGRYQFLPTMLPQMSVSADWKSSRHFDGDVDDSDYLASNPNKVWAFSNSDLSGNWDQLDANVGFEILNLKDGKVTAEALGGYQRNHYDFSIHTTVTSIWNYVAIDDKVFGETATYKANMKAPYVGVAGKAWFTPHFGVNASIKYLIKPKADARGVWQLNDFFFTEHGKGHGYEASLGATLIPRENWYVSLQLYKSNIEIDNGREDLYVNSGTQRFLGSDELDYIEFDSTSTEFRVGFLF